MAVKELDDVNDVNDVNDVQLSLSSLVRSCTAYFLLSATKRLTEREGERYEKESWELTVDEGGRRWRR